MYLKFLFKMKKICFYYFLITLCFSSNLFATEILLLKTYEKKKDVVGWLMSEKLDGIRGVWTGKVLLSKNGNPIYAPRNFIKALPPFALDGELWTFQNDFETIQSIVLRNQPDNRWDRIKYYIFEVPNQQGGLLERLTVLKDYLKLNPKAANVIKIIRQERVVSIEHLESRLDKVLAAKGEGLVVRNGKIPYHTGRSRHDLKVKKAKYAECTVVGFKQGKGKFTGLVGSLICELANKEIIHIGSGLTLKERKLPPETGSMITFKYYGLTKNGKPKFPVFMRERQTE